ncbi:uncharacterized protein LOC144545929 [Carex rostrata]
MAMLPFLKQNSYVRSSLSPLRTIFNTSICRLLSTASQVAPSASPASNFAVEYLINTCGLPSDRAIAKSRYLPHLKSPEKPDAVLQFLRQVGITEPQIRAAAFRNPGFLCLSVEKCFKPRMAELQEIGFSPSHISLLFSIYPLSFQCTRLQQQIQFWMPIVGSVEKLLHLCKRSFYLLTANLETSVIPNLSFLQQQCSLSVCQIVRLINSASRLITSSHESLVSKVSRAEELGVPRSSGVFLNALIVVSCLKESTIDSRLLYWRSLGFSPKELNSIICKAPMVLGYSENLIGCKMEFLINEAACDKLHVVQNPVLFMLSLEKRLRPRILVRKLLESKGFPVTKLSVFMKYIEVRFVEKFILPYEHTIPGLHQAYKDACSGNVSGLNFLQKTSS